MPENTSIRPLISAGSNIARIAAVIVCVLVASASSQTIEKQALTHLDEINCFGYALECFVDYPTKA